MPNQKFSSPLTNDCVNNLYNHYLKMYQGRYTETFFFIVTFSHIHYWRMMVTFYGNVLITRKLITREKYLQQKNYRTGGAQQIARMQQITVNNTSDISGMRFY